MQMIRHEAVRNNFKRIIACTIANFAEYRRHDFLAGKDFLTLKSADGQGIAMQSQIIETADPPGTFGKHATSTAIDVPTALKGCGTGFDRPEGLFHRVR